jgi:hypothetical protein
MHARGDRAVLELVLHVSKSIQESRRNPDYAFSPEVAGYCFLKYAGGRCPGGEENVDVLRTDELIFVDDDGTVWSLPVGR